MSKAGARDNAGTGDDSTHYYATFAKEQPRRSSASYADTFQHLAYSEADFKTEARAILGEYNKNSADPSEKLFEVQREHFFQAHTYKHTTMGFIADIENMPNEYRVLEGVLRTMVPAAVHDHHRGRRRHAGTRCCQWSRNTGAGGRPGSGAGGHPDGTCAEGAPVRPRAMDQRHAALRHGCVSRHPLSSRTSKDSAAMHILARPVLRFDVGNLQEAGRGRAESRLDRRSTCRITSTRRSSPSSPG